jgi:hypothetical protein
MSMNKVLVSTGIVLAFTAGFALRGVVGPETVVSAQAAPAAQPGGRVFEIRTYVASAGRFEALKTRFRDHTIKYFDKYNMKSVGYWTPVTGTPGAGNTLIYILQHESRDAATKSWASFNADPDWVKARQASIDNGGNPVARADSTFVEAVDFSPIK